MQSIRDVIKQSIIYSLEELGQPTVLHEKLYKKFVAKHKMTRKQLGRLVDANAYKLVTRKKERLPIPMPTKNEYHALLKIANHYELTTADIISNSRVREHVDARRIYTVILYVYLNNTLSKTGLKIMRDHSTVINSTTRHEHLVQYEPHYRKKFLTIIQELKEEVPDMFEIEYNETIPEYDKKLTTEKWEKLADYMKKDSSNKKLYGKNN